MDYNISNQAQNIINTCDKIVSANNPLQHSMLLTFIVGVHDIINRLSESYCTDSNSTKQNDYCNKIITYSQKVLIYVKNYADSQPLLECNFIKSIIIRILSAYAHVFLYKKDYEELRKAINFFDDLAKILNIKEKTPSYELFLKIRGDYMLSKRMYLEAISLYNKAIEIMNFDSHKKAILNFFEVLLIKCKDIIR